MSTPHICFHEKGLIYQNKRYKWTKDEIPETYPTIVQFYFMLYHAQERWKTVIEKQLKWTPVAECINIIRTTHANSNIANLETVYASATATHMTQIALNEIQEIAKKGLDDLKARKYTEELLFLCSAAMNPNILHFLCLLSPEQIVNVFRMMQLHKELFPIYVSPIDHIGKQPILKHEWMENPFATTPKIQFYHATGNLE